MNLIYEPSNRDRHPLPISASPAEALYVIGLLGNVLVLDSTRKRSLKEICSLHLIEHIEVS